MDDSLIDLFKKFDNQSIKDNREKIKTKFYKEIDELRKKDYEFSKMIEREENRLLTSILFNHKKYSSKLNNLIKNYDCLIRLKSVTDIFKDLENTD